MCSNTVPVAEPFGAKLAFEILLSRVYFFMALHVGLAHEPLPAILTEVPLALDVFRFVELPRRLGDETLDAILAFISSFPMM